ncbi:Oxoglutarate/iron-dependent dioxygenase [Penicillium griseofulvum]|uniref:Oxoglutarate/iron-dependent dioxygenase n=1 Tax=Penicillium patulum TaxID=5078 RepID=A0A135LY52_PENPA|nr:Oxoglutarate/iron-dependent dioxygenase [Penicillium griseofulvum]KXG53841.1 Oxoglutarate/iron-dependent dioxygenase [Penicillium griseofulvum]
MAVPTLNYSHFISGTKEQREKFAHDLLDSFERTGFAKLKAHAFSTQELTELFNWGHKFFDRPLDVKNRIPNETGPRPMRGYTPWRVEEVGKLHHDAKVRIMKDSKEHFDQGPEYDTEFPNKWPQEPELSGFQEFMEEFYRKCNGVCLALMGALEVAWGIDDGSLVARCIPSATDLRLTHYPTIPVDDLKTGGTSRIAPHTDFGPVTLLFQDSTGGLEIEDRTSNTFVPLPPTDTTEMIVNVGDTLTRWTNGKITGGIHQVTTPQSMKGESGLVIPPRMSMAYLFKAGRNTSVGPLPKFLINEPAKYPEITAFEFQRWKNSIVYNVEDEEHARTFERFIEAPKAIKLQA